MIHTRIGKMKYNLPVLYSKLKRNEKRPVREQYIEEQNGQCYWCKTPLAGEPPKEVTDKPINLRLFPQGFLNNPVHLQHNHDTDETEGAVHAYCNAIMWQYHGR